MSIDLEGLRQQYVADFPRYEALAERVKEIVRSDAVAAGIRCLVDHRVKTVASLLKKAVRKDREGSVDSTLPVYGQIRDKAGVRVVVTYYDDVPRVDEMLQRLFPGVEGDNKARELDHAEVGYLGVHYEVTLPAESIGPSEVGLRGLECEIQVHTQAQSAWAKVAHELSYKPSQRPEEAILRMIYRLAALMEIFDDQAQRARSAVHGQQGFPEAAVLDRLEEHFYRFTGRDFDRLLSLEIVKSLMPLIENREQAFGPALDAFVERHGTKIEEVFESYADDDRNLLLFQPESLLVFEHLEEDPFRLADVWMRSLPMDLLEPLAAVWGKPVTHAA